MADTITILDGLANTQPATSQLVDFNDPIKSVVGTWAVHVPLSAKQARVVFNNLYGGGTPNVVACRVRVTKVTGMTTTGVTKTETTEALAWYPVGTFVWETDSIDVSDSKDTTLHIDCCIIVDGIHGGTEIIVQVASEAGVDDAWTDIARFVGPIGDAIDENIASEEVAGQTIISLTDPVITHMDNDGKFKFIISNNLVDSEIVYQVSNSGD